MRQFKSLFGPIVLSNERLRHILRFHPDVRGSLRHFTSTLEAPDETLRSAHDPQVVMCYRYLPSRKRHLAIVVHVQKRFIVTAYLARKRKRDTL